MSLLSEPGGFANGLVAETPDSAPNRTPVVMINTSSAFWTAFWAGVAAPVSLFAAPVAYAAYTTVLSPAQSFSVAGGYLSAATRKRRMTSTPSEPNQTPDPNNEKDQEDLGENPVGHVAQSATPSKAEAAPIFLNPFQNLPGVQMAAQVQVWQGQFPPPEAIERYEAILPGTFERIVAMAEHAQIANIEATAQARSFLHQDTQRGHWLGWAVTMASIVGALVCAWMKQPIVACALVAVPVMSVATALINTRARIIIPPQKEPQTRNE